MKTIIKLFALPVLLIAVSCSVESVAESAEELNAVTLKGKRKGNCDVYKERPSRNTYVGAPAPGNTFSGTWGYPVGDFTGTSVITGFVINADGTATQTLDATVIAEGGDEFYTSSDVLITFTSETTGTYTLTFEVNGGTGRFAGATGSFRVKNGRFDETGVYHNAIGKIYSKGLCDD